MSNADADMDADGDADADAMVTAIALPVLTYRRAKNKVSVHPAKTQISLGIHPVWSVFAVRSMGS